MAQQTILLIEDNPMNRELAADLLGMAGYTVLQAENAEEGIALAAAHPPGLVLMDIALPGMDGLAATHVLRRDPRLSHVPVVALTAHAMKGDADRALAAGCAGYITKPIDTRAFPEMVAAFFHARPERKAA